MGGGLLGAAAAAALADAGRTVVVLEARKKGHSEGSSHGHSRIVRTLGSETPVFAQMARDSFGMMRALNSRRRAVVRDVPAVFVARKDTEGFEALRSADPDAEPLSPGEVRERYGLSIGEDFAGFADPTSGVMDPVALLDVLYARVQSVSFETNLVRWDSGSTGVTIVTGRGETISAGQLVLAAGAWLPQLLERGPVDSAVKVRLGRMRLERIPLFYFAYPRDLAPVIPITVFDDGVVDMYGMPEWRGAEEPQYLKIGFHRGTRADRPEHVSRTVEYLEERYAAEYASRLLGRTLGLRETSVCLYALAPDGELPLLGALPGTANVFLAAYGGGICAKHSLALGQALSCLMLGKQGPYETLDAFDPRRL